MPETVFTARGNFAQLVADAIAARDALQGMDKTVTAKAKLDKSDVDVQKSLVDKQLDALQRRIATATLKADSTQAQAEIKKLEAQLARLREASAKINVKVDGAAATAQLRAISLEADKVARDRRLKINADTAGAQAQVGLLAKSLDGLKKKGDIFAGGFISDIVSIVAFMSGPLSTAFAVALVGMAGLISVVGALGLGFGALGAVILPALSGIKKNISSVTQAQTDLNNATTNADKLKALKALQDAYAKIPADQKPVVQGVLDLEGALRKIGDQVLPQVMHAFTSFLNGIKAVLPFVSTLAHSTADGLALLGVKFEDAARRAATSPYWQGIIKLIGQEIPKYILALGHIFGGMFSALVKLIADFAPAGEALLGWIGRLVDKFNSWAQNKGAGDIQKVLEYIHKNGPALGKTLGDVAKALGDTALALSKLPLSGVVLKTIDDLAKALDAIVKTPVGAWAVGLLLMSGGIAKIVATVAGKTLALIDFARGITGVGEAALTKGSAGAYSMGTALDFMLDPVGAVLLALAALGVGIYFIVTKWKEISEALHKPIWNLVAAGIATLLGPVGWVILAAVEIALHWRGLWNVLQQIGDWIRTAFFATWHALVDVWHVVVEAVKIGWAIWKAEFNAAKTVVETVWHAIMAAFNFARGVIVGVIDYISDHWAAIWRIIMIVIAGAVGYIVDAIVTHFGAIRDFIVGIMMFIWHNIIEPVWHAIQTVITTVINVIRDIITTVWNFISGFLDSTHHTIQNIITTVWNAIRDAINAVVNFIWHSVIEPVWNGIKSTIETVVNFIWHNIIEPAFNGIRNTVMAVVGFIWHNVIEPAWNTISDITGRIWGGIKDTIVNMITAARDLVKPIINGIIGFINLIAKGIKAVAGFIHIDVGYGDPAIQPLAKGGVIGYEGVVKMAGGGCMDCELGAAMMGGGVGRVGAGFRTSGPTAIVGEGRQQYPEYVIPTDPAFRQNAYGLAASMLMDIGMMQGGGIFRGRIGSLTGDIGTGIDLNPWHVAKGIWHKAEDIGGSVISGIGDAGKWIMDRVRDGIASAVSGLASTLGYKWPTKPTWWGASFPAEAGLIGGIGNDAVGSIINLIRGKEADAKAASGGSGIGGAGPAAAGVCADWINQGLNWPGANKSFSAACMAGRVNNESGCNPRAINLTDSNALAGHPSVGLTQFIPSTFASQSCPGCTDIWNPVCQVCASSHCSPGNCGHGGYGCAAGAMLGQGGIPDITGVPAGAARRGWIGALERMTGRRVLGQTTGEKMLLGMVNKHLASGGTISASALLANATHFPTMGSGGVIGRMPKLQAGGALGGSNRTHNINIYNPVGETAEDSLSTTLTKLSYRGVLR